MVALVIRITTFNLFFSNEFFIRLGPIILAALNTFLVFRIANKIKDEKAGIIAALLFTGSPYCSILTGIFILPDSPQLFFWIVAISFLVDISSQEKDSSWLNKKLLLFGLVAGLCIMSKVHGVFLWIGFGAYILIYQRSFLRNGYLYLAMLITIAIVSPIVIWNFENNFITYAFHSKRVSISSGPHLESFIRELSGDIVYNNPVCWILIVLAILSFFKNNNYIRLSSKRILLLLSFPLIISLLIISVFRNTLPHWSGPAYTSLIILAGCYISFVCETEKKSGRKLYLLTWASAIFLTVVTIAGILVVNFMPGTFGKKNAELLGDGDFTLDMYGWNSLKEEFKKIYDQNNATGVTSSAFIISNKWFPGAHIDNYIAQPLQLNFIAIGDLNDIHTYAWLNNYRKKIRPGDDAYFITLSDNFCDPVKKYKTLFIIIDKPIVIHQFRGGRPVRNVLIYLLKNYQAQTIPM